MIIVVLTDCPPRLRGDLSKWLFEINTGVYVGRVSARVREELWARICQSLNRGQATMVYPAQGEQRMEFRVHNTSWEVVDYDGLKLMRRPFPGVGSNQEQKSSSPAPASSRAAQYHQNRRIQISRQKNNHRADYTVLDLETTGLSHLKDHILEIAALKIQNGHIAKKFQALVQCPVKIPETVTQLTGLTEEMLADNGRPLNHVLEECLNFIGTDLLVLHNAAFDYGFLQVGCRKSGLPVPRNPCVDTLRLAREKLRELSSYSLEDVAGYFGFDVTGCHRAEKDCHLTFGIYEKLKEI